MRSLRKLLICQARVPGSESSSGYQTAFEFAHSGAWVTEVGVCRTLISGGLDRLPMPQPLCDQLRAFPSVAVEDAHVLGIRAQVDTGRARVHSRVRVRT